MTGLDAAGTPSEQTFLLIQRHRGGDPEALRQLVERYYPRVRRIVGVRVRQRLLALTTIEDVVQDVFVRVIEGLESYELRDDARWIDWVARIAEREIYGQARHHDAVKRDANLVDLVRHAAGSVTSWSLPADTTGVDAKVAIRELEELVDQCLSSLPEAHREVVLLRDYAGDSWRSIAEKMGRPSPEACQELHRRALRELRECVRRKI
jgi:RNA polymerase sigma-70 factor (ECF subfamily)